MIGLTLPDFRLGLLTLGPKMWDHFTLPIAGR